MCKLRAHIMSTIEIEKKQTKYGNLEKQWRKQSRHKKKKGPKERYYKNKVSKKKNKQAEKHREKLLKDTKTNILDKGTRSFLLNGKLSQLQLYGNNLIIEFSIPPFPPLLPSPLPPTL